jgi:hypothetical protein
MEQERVQSFSCLEQKLELIGVREAYRWLFYPSRSSASVPQPPLAGQVP